MLSTIDLCGKRLQWLDEVLYYSHPLYQHDIPDPISMNIGKLGSGFALTSYTWDGARKTRLIIFEQVHEAAEALQKDDSDEISVLEVDLLEPPYKRLDWGVSQSPCLL